MTTTDELSVTVRKIANGFLVSASCHAGGHWTRTDTTYCPTLATAGLHLIQMLNTADDLPAMAGSKTDADF